MEQLHSGKLLFGKAGAFAPMLKEFLKCVMEAEIDDHLDDEEREDGNRKNGRTIKRVKIAEGTLGIETPRERATTFEPQIIKKRETILAESLENKILGLYGRGINLRYLSAHQGHVRHRDLCNHPIYDHQQNYFPC